MRPRLVVLALIIAGLAGVTLIKQGGSLRIATASILFAAMAPGWAWVLARMPLGATLAAYAAMSMSGGLIIGAMLFDEAVTNRELVGVVFGLLSVIFLLP